MALTALHDMSQVFKGITDLFTILTVSRECMPLDEWITAHPRIAVITSIALAAIGASCITVVSTVALTAVAATALGISAGASLACSFALFISYVINQFIHAPQAQDPSPINNPRPSRAHLPRITQETLAVIRAGEYTSSNGTKHVLGNIAQSIAGTRFVRSAGAAVTDIHNTHTYVINQDCLVASKFLLDKGLNPLVFDFANATVAGGGYRGYADAQEEKIFRRSTLPIAVDSSLGRQRNFFPLNNDGENRAAGLYVPHVTIFRGPGYEFLDEPFEISVAVMAAPCRPSLHRDRLGRLRLRDPEAAVVADRIRTVCHMAVQNGHDSLVLGAFGCGAFGLPPDHVAEIFYRVLHDYRGYFREVAFAILDDHNTGKAHNPHGNYAPFKEMFPD